MESKISSSSESSSIFISVPVRIRQLSLRIFSLFQRVHPGPQNSSQNRLIQMPIRFSSTSLESVRNFLGICQNSFRNSSESSTGSVASSSGRALLLLRYLRRILRIFFSQNPLFEFPNHYCEHSSRILLRIPQGFPQLFH